MSGGAWPRDQVTVVVRELAAWRLAVALKLADLILPPMSLRRARAMLIGAVTDLEVAVGAEIAGGFRVTGTRLVLGRGAYIGPNCFMDIHRNAFVRIGERVSVGPRCLFITSDHEIGAAERRAGAATCAGITVEAGAWIGAGVTILPGVTVGAGAVVAAGSLVINDVAPDTLAAGRPARKVRQV